MTTKKKNDSLFHSRNFNLVFLGSFVSELGAVLYSFAVSFYILEISGSNAFLQGLYLAVCGVVMLVFTPLGGVLGDRYSKARIMYLCDYGKGGTILASVVMMLMLRENVHHIVILFVSGILGNIISGIFSPAAGALLPYIVRDDQLQKANAFFSVKNSLQSIFGVVLAGILYTALPITTLFLIVGVCYLISGVSEMFIRYEYTPPKDRLTLQTVLSDMEEGYRYLRSRKAVIVLMIAALFINFFITPLFGNFVPYFIKTDLISSPAYLFDSFMKPELWSSILSMLVGISSLLGALLMTMKEEQGKYGMKIAIRFCVMALTVSVMAAAYWLLVARGVSLNLFLILCSLCAFSIGFIIPLVNIPINTLMMRIIDRSQLSKVNGMISIVSQALIPLASVLAGSVLQIWGSSVLLFFCAVGLTVSAVYFLLQPETRTF
ncbi:MAG: MFS transporter [Solobacterium sp.]|nr:MFS transporter [Solobacterium sp.]